eukprot:868251-Prymnesium_polylepis.1
MGQEGAPFVASQCKIVLRGVAVQVGGVKSACGMLVHGQEIHKGGDIVLDGKQPEGGGTGHDLQLDEADPHGRNALQNHSHVSPSSSVSCVSCSARSSHAWR